MMTRYVFEEVKHKDTKTNVCIKCGKKNRRSKTFYQTINPYNKNREGFVKSRAEIMVELCKEARVWREEHCLCVGCEE